MRSKSIAVPKYMAILLGTLSSLGEAGKTSETRGRPVVLSKGRSCDHFLWQEGDLGQTSDRLPVKVTCIVTVLCKVPFASKDYQQSYFSSQGTFNTSEFSNLARNLYWHRKIIVNKLQHIFSVLLGDLFRNQNR